jgi:pyrimidine operon attenuation protein/uracil phosphoribosyltransferase
VQYIKEDMTLD